MCGSVSKSKVSPKQCSVIFHVMTDIVLVTRKVARYLSLGTYTRLLM